MEKVQWLSCKIYPCTQLPEMQQRLWFGMGNKSSLYVIGDNTLGQLAVDKFFAFNPDWLSQLVISYTMIIVLFAHKYIFSISLKLKSLTNIGNNTLLHGIDDNVEILFVFEPNK